MAVHTLNTGNFDDVVNSADKPVIVDFYADWCGPCKMIAPVVEKLSEEFENEIIFCKVNVDESPEVAERFLIQNIPTFISFKNGQQHNMMVGGGSRQKLLDLIK